MEIVGARKSTISLIWLSIKSGVMPALTANSFVEELNVRNLLSFKMKKVMKSV